MKVYKTHFSEKESDITIISESNSAILKARKTFYLHRRILETYVSKNNQFLTSLSPIKVNTEVRIIQLMAEAAYICNVGPMAAVAGALADLMLDSMKAREEKENSDFVEAKIALVENGGEIAIDSVKPMNIALYAGNNELNLNIGFLIEKKDCPIGIGTSSATIGHAISFGQADVVTIFATNATLADAAATRVANSVKGEDVEKSIKRGLDVAEDIDGIIGTFISRGDKIGQAGKLPKFVKIEGDKRQLLREKLDDIFLGDYEIFK
ncbi:MAG: UPF0280 family protein [Candidatus Thorarchaeota archaeon]